MFQFQDYLEAAHLLVNYDPSSFAEEKVIHQNSYIASGWHKKGQILRNLYHASVWTFFNVHFTIIE